MHAEVAKELYQFAEEVMKDSKEVVPVLTGALMNTGKVQPPKDENGMISVTLGYGDEAVGYALYVHEALEGARAPNPNWSWAKAAAKGHPIKWTRPGSGPKFLSRPLQAKQDQLPGRVQAGIMRALKSV
jgi:hypothetical protein